MVRLTGVPDFCDCPREGPETHPTHLRVAGPLCRLEGEISRLWKHVLAMRTRDDLHLMVESHARLFEIGAEDAVDQPDRRKILDAGKAERLQLTSRTLPEK